MNKTLIALALALATFSASAGVKEIGTINGLKVVRIKTAGVFAPSTTTIVTYDPAKPGTIEGVLNGTGGPGFIPAVATAGGIVGGAAVLRPSRVKQSGGGATASSSSHSSSRANASAHSNSQSSSTSTGGGTQNGSIHHNN